MKNLNEYPTPITRELFELYRQRAAMPWELQPMFEDIERKLAACREALGESEGRLIREGVPEDSFDIQLIRETLAATAP